MNRRTLVAGIALISAAVITAGLPGGSTAQPKVVKIGLSLPLTGADADGADAILKGAQMAMAEINAKGGVAGYKLESVVFDSATPAAGQYDPAQAATNYKKFIADSLVLAAVGPVMSGEGKAISPILSEADMATITPSSTNPDITDPKFQSQYRPKGKAVVGAPNEVITTQTLSALYGAKVEVLRASDGRLVVVGTPEAPALHADRHAG